MKYCPVCDAEYADSHAMCSVCSVELVPEELRGQPLDERQRKEKIVLAWKGGDPLAVSGVIHILRDAGIRHHVQPTNEHLVLGWLSARPKYAVRLFSSDVWGARELLSNVLEIIPSACDERVERDANSNDDRARATDHDFQPKEATTVVW